MGIVKWRFDSASRPAASRDSKRNCGQAGASLALLAGLACVVPPVPASAHHSTSGYDYTKNVRLAGTVRSFQWGNPHCYLQLTVDDGKGGVREWAIETGTPATNARAGWSQNTLKPGDKVTVEIAPARAGAGGTLRTIQLPNGKVLKGAGAMVPAGGGLPSGGPVLPTLPRVTPK